MMSEFETYTAPPPPPSSTGPVSAEEKQWAMFGHLSTLLGLFTGGIGNIVGPLVIWLVKKDTMPFAGDQAKEALNFNITLLLIGVVLLVLTLVTFGIGAIVTMPLGLLLCVAWLVLTIIAAMKANEGVAYRYPFTLRLVK
ncbi:DUF4870 domain-containing protein [Pseudoxanthomonas sp. 10H]|uniref:DUF4870 domain-containing protein n=1 Tax=Pseudoxanthomonas sp. 10H TaxID=3242729 RepID=UPI0035576704